jgi:hypothetical protein
MRARRSCGTLGRNMDMTVARLAVPLVLCSFSALADQVTPAPVHYELRLIHIFEGKEPKHVFVIGDSGFTSVETLKGFLGTLPAGSSIRWAPGCDRFEKEPLLSSERDMREFSAFLKRRGISFVLVPSG